MKQIFCLMALCFLFNIQASANTQWLVKVAGSSEFILQPSVQRDITFELALSRPVENLEIECHADSALVLDREPKWVFSNDVANSVSLSFSAQSATLGRHYLMCTASTAQSKKTLAGAFGVAFQVGDKEATANKGGPKKIIALPAKETISTLKD